MTRSSRRELHFHSMADAVTDVLHLHDSGYQQLGNWSLPVMLDHLNKTMAGAFEPTIKPFPAPVRWILRRTVYRRLVSGKPLPFSAPAPKEIQPSADSEFEPAFEQFERLCKDLDNPAIPVLDLNPAFGNFDRSEWVRLNAWHAQHHLSFLIPKATG